MTGNKQSWFIYSCNATELGVRPRKFARLIMSLFVFDIFANGVRQYNSNASIVSSLDHFFKFYLPQNHLS